MSHSSLRDSAMARVNEGSHSFAVLPTTTTFIHKWNKSAWQAAAEHHQHLAGAHFPSH